MADGSESQVAAQAQTAVSSPLSSQNPNPSESQSTVAGDGSVQKPASPDTTSQTQKTEAAAAVNRPEGIPDTYWDSTANTLKVDPATLAKDLRERDELKTFKAAEEVKAAQRPQKAEDYKLELPPDFKLPAGVEYKLDASNPALGSFQQIAHKHGLSQDAVKDILGVYAGHEVGTQETIANARKAELGKLGTTAPARVDSVVNWLTGMDASSDKKFARALAQMLVTADHVVGFENIINKLTSQGAATFSQQHRVAPDANSIPGYDKMSFEQRRSHQDMINARRRAS